MDQTKGKTEPARDILGLVELDNLGITFVGELVCIVNEDVTKKGVKANEGGGDDD